MKQIKEILLTCLILSLQYNTHWAWKMSMVSQFPISDLKTVSSLPFQSIECNRQLQHYRPQRLILGLRGGSDEEDTEEDTESDHDDDDDELEHSEEETDKDSSISNLDESQQNDDDNSNSNNKDNEEMENDKSNTSISSSPVKITLKTAVTNNPLIEQSIEITASPTRTVHSLKQSVSRQFKSKPPIESIQLRLDGQLLDDDETLVEDLIVEDDEDDDDEEDEDHDGMPKLNIVVDMIPPVDPKFGTEMKDRLDHVTNEQLLEAYVVNLAAMHQNSIDVMAHTMESNPSAEDDTVDEERMEEELEETVTSEPVLPVNLALQKYATMMKSQIIHSLSEGEKTLLEKMDTPSSPISQDDVDTYNTGDLLLKESIKRKKRRGGATINMKRVIQKNLNINWPDTIRNFLLFLFFGYFGGRNAMSRTIMLLGAPACFIIQARPVKIAMKQLFYTIGEPPGILLSLLPAPQQTIMSCDYNDSLKSIYGDDILTCNDAVTNQDVVDDDDDDEQISTSVYDSDDGEYSQDDDEYDSDY